MLSAMLAAGMPSNTSGKRGKQKQNSSAGDDFWKAMGGRPAPKPTPTRWDPLSSQAYRLYYPTQKTQGSLSFLKPFSWEELTPDPFGIRRNEYHLDLSSAMKALKATERAAPRLTFTIRDENGKPYGALDLTAAMDWLDSQFGKGPGYRNRRDAIKYRLQGLMSRGAITADEATAAAVQTMQGRRDAPSRAELQNVASQVRSSNPTYIGSKAQDRDIARMGTGETPDEKGQRIYREKAAAGHNPIEQAIQAANLDMVPIISGLIRNSPGVIVAAGEGFSHPAEETRREVEAINKNPLVQFGRSLTPAGNVAAIADGITLATDATRARSLKPIADAGQAFVSSNNPFEANLPWQERLVRTLNFGSLIKGAHESFQEVRSQGISGSSPGVQEPSGDGFDYPSREGTTPELMDLAQQATAEIKKGYGVPHIERKVLGNAIATDLTAGKGVNLVGKHLFTPEGVAFAAQFLRDPRMETIRVVFTKNGKVIEHEAGTSRLPGSAAPFFEPHEKDWNTRLNRRMKEVGADGYLDYS